VAGAFVPLVASVAAARLAARRSRVLDLIGGAPSEAPSGSAADASAGAEDPER
jgi:hypothetical protein